ncbi:unnamed protein product [Parascedosporium putredinis]|uniref:Uncharacterized protein n=1 Tax=Parascedosporium putredinis TaxID=1442378 RepID=A0A9P1GXT8_9PEZI|nr:unnamed protein product [Parascedosporium putredinis]CAI7990123.1 unnamed protein product [Parascedosporium putredinis]
MDPASALGVAAASVQLSGVAAIAVLRGIGILKTFKETPANLAELLIDVERSILSTLNLRNQLMNPASNLRQRLPSGQHQALHDALDETYEATLGLQEIIEPLLADSSITSLHLQADLVGLSQTTSQAFLSLQSELALRTANPSASNDSVNKVDESPSTIDELGSLSSGLDGTPDTPPNAPTDLGPVRHKSMAHAKSRTNSRTSSQVQSQLTFREMVTLRDGVLPVITGREPSMSGAAQNIAERLSDTDKRDMVVFLIDELIRTPRTLHEICDEIIPRHESLVAADESGQTLLVEILVLIGLFAPIYGHLVEEFDALLLIAQESGLETDSPSHAGNRRYICNSIRETLVGYSPIGNIIGWTVTNMAHDYVRFFSRQLQNYSFFARVLTFCPPEGQPEATPFSSLKITATPPTRLSIATMLLHDTWLSKHFSREISLDSPNWSTGAFSSLFVNVLELAIGWKEGLLILATRWTYTLTPAIELAVKKKDVESLDILCNKFNAPLFSDDDEFRSYILSLLSYEEACILLVKALKRRRDALAGLARRYLSSYDLSQLGIKDGRTLDVTARPVFDLLSKRAIPLDPWLFPGPKSSIYYTLSAVWTLGNMSGCFGMTFALDELFTSNFRDFDYPNDSSSPYWLWVDEEENVRLRDEDEELAEQLEWWWSKVGQILPDDSSKVCDDGMAFLDVIQHHFQVKIVDLPEQFNSGDTVVDSSLHNEANTLADGGTGPGTERPRNSLSESKGVFVPQKRPDDIIPDLTIPERRQRGNTWAGGLNLQHASALVDCAPF